MVGVVSSLDPWSAGTELLVAVGTTPVRVVVASAETVAIARAASEAIGRNWILVFIFF